MEDELLVCKICGSINIQTLHWIDSNTKVFKSEGPGEEESNWCIDCEQHVEIITLQEFNTSSTAEFDSGDILSDS